MNRVLIVEDEQHLAEGLRFNLEAEGYRAQVVQTGEEALELLLAKPVQFDVLVLDVMLPGKDGFSVMSETRQAGQLIPTLMLTARGRSDDVLKGFAAGADDYLTKPFELAILLARMRGLLRRREWIENSFGNAGRAADRADVFRFGENGEKTVSFDLLELSVRGRTFRLTLMEATVLRFLVQHEGKPVSRKQMIEQIWGLREDTDTRPIDNFIVRLRRYIEDDPASPRHVLTVRGVGYQFIAAPSRKK
jgi:two-component system, OmpR family, alkaline phosphatase synthesis response regulator PhoP